MVGMTQEEMRASSERKLETFGKPHRELSSLVPFPPFSTDAEKASEFMAAILDDVQPNADEPFAEVTSKWADEIAEARMYQKRYAMDARAATQAAAKLQSG